jgi:hypothetical protein
MNWSLIIRRAIVLLALALAVGIGYLQYVGLSGRGRVKDANFIQDAMPVPAAYRRALGPGPPMVRLVIEPTRASADVLNGPGQVTPYLFERERGFVVASPAQPFDEAEPNRVAFVLSAVDFVALRGEIELAQRELGIEQAARVVIDRLPDAAKLRCRVYAPAPENGDARMVERSLERSVDGK